MEGALRPWIGRGGHALARPGDARATVAEARLGDAVAGRVVPAVAQLGAAPAAAEPPDEPACVATVPSLCDQILTVLGVCAPDVADRDREPDRPRIKVRRDVLRLKNACHDIGQKKAVRRPSVRNVAERARTPRKLAKAILAKRVPAVENHRLPVRTSHKEVADRALVMGEQFVTAHRSNAAEVSERAAKVATVVPGKLFPFAKIYKSPRLTVMFSGIKICVSSSMPIRPYPELLLINSSTCLVFVSTLYS
jgi:hypothetical protein